jgi:hypothetical protein
VILTCLSLAIAIYFLPIFLKSLVANNATLFGLQKSVEELYHSPPMEIGSADTSRLEDLHGQFQLTSK